MVLNKSDLGHNFDQGLKNFRGKHFLRVSALTGAGIDDLCGAISELVEQFSLESGEDMVAINARHSKALREANAGLSAAQAKLEADEPMELLASELRGVLAAYGEITGKIDNERMLDQLFATFCIGK